MNMGGFRDVTEQCQPSLMNKALSGTFTPPKDLTPAYEALGEWGKAYLKAITGGGTYNHHHLAMAADKEREYLGKS